MGFPDVSNFVVLENAYPSVTCFSSEASSKYFLTTEWATVGMPASEDVQQFLEIITEAHEVLLFSLCIKSTIVVFKMTKQLSEENGGGPFCQQGNYQE